MWSAPFGLSAAHQLLPPGAWRVGGPRCPPSGGRPHSGFSGPSTKPGKHPQTNRARGAIHSRVSLCEVALSGAAGWPDE